MIDINDLKVGNYVLKIADYANRYNRSSINKVIEIHIEDKVLSISHLNSDQFEKISIKEIKALNVTEDLLHLLDFKNTDVYKIEGLNNYVLLESSRGCKVVLQGDEAFLLDDYSTSDHDHFTIILPSGLDKFKFIHEIQNVLNEQF